MIASDPGLVQKPAIRWAPDHLFTHPDYRDLILLYYTGITRVAKHILTDIVRGMLLNSSAHLGILAEMKNHAVQTYEAIQHHNWNDLAMAVRHSWELNQQLDPGTNPEQISSIIKKIDPYMDSCKLLGAGGGGYLMIFSKDRRSADEIKTILQKQPPNATARFVDWKISSEGFTLTKS